MVDWWLGAAAALPAAVAAAALALRSSHSRPRRRRKSSSAEEEESLGGREKLLSSDDIFVCRRVCTSKRMLNKVGAFSKDPVPSTCVTVCGVSDVDACTDACSRTICANPHHVPSWNDTCLRRCQSQCLKLRHQEASNV